MPLGAANGIETCFKKCGVLWADMAFYPPLSHSMVQARSSNWQSLG
jgi:hypothetical protein